ncbi:Methionine aminopeptidase 1 [Cricetulus griseus]|uniref:Methionine aminopeptidase 1 n=1 Tax=Cricetulus griseus TaxID=10029 RepID=G3IMB6_CRIGR|nr:Methionine aminopeptidase 1 [Cricetulus griseus]
MTEASLSSLLPFTFVHLSLPEDEKAKREVCSWTVEGDVNTDPWAGYRYTGKLRPHYPLMPTRPVPSYIQRPDYADHPLVLKTAYVAIEDCIQKNTVFCVRNELPDGRERPE